MAEGVQAEDDSMYAGLVEKDYVGYPFGKCVRKSLGNIQVKHTSRATIAD